jgi:hypothetical protein
MQTISTYAVQCYAEQTCAEGASEQVLKDRQGAMSRRLLSAPLCCLYRAFVSQRLALCSIVLLTSTKPLPRVYSPAIPHRTFMREPQLGVLYRRLL